ncbi:hypothetical protein ACVIW2_009210 [Bradyrhizobium huanghuaihaiense]|jgi:hypothetical protein|uniref:Uncharacterized protein n=1 Tax=Bradyrhizobium ottawaense TaxID=931866 RepID=A0ABV4FIP1_9BRAD|nr:hypothetical protein [Bradyrhizobium elkanii]MCP1748823.1 hypothetical protein [Bradyrhizobium japonicum]MCP1737548.1 hypothetical protein [Bradyrhizobium elkanii]MCP1784367.1 hypothetical protein [Bradyrhizobium japonicum]MCP1866318.1 hypothetical protein [Bradyrhizobium japonicum]
MLFFFLLSIAFAVFGTIYTVSAWLSRRPRSRNFVRPTQTPKRRAF